MRFESPGMATSLKVAICLMALATELVGCASRPPVMANPPAPELRARMDRVALRVFTDSAPTTYSADAVLTGAGAGAGYAAKNVAKVGAATGLGIAGVGCNPGWGIFWPVTCAAGLVGGAAVGVGTAVVGGAAGAAYGASRARTQEEYEAAAQTLEKSLADIELSAVFREHLVSATHSETPARIIPGMPRHDAAENALDDQAYPTVIAIRIDTFSIKREGQLTPELSLQLGVSADVFESPESGMRYTRGWNLATTLGGFYALTDTNAAGLRQEINEALKTMAAVVAKDIFVTTEPVEVHSGKPVNGEVASSYSRELESTRERFRELKRDAECGNSAAQAELGRAYAGVDSRVYPDLSQSLAVAAYVWLRRAQAGGGQVPDSADDLRRMRERLSPTQIENAERKVSEWHVKQCHALPDAAAHQKAELHERRGAPDVVRTALETR